MSFQIHQVEIDPQNTRSLYDRYRGLANRVFGKNAVGFDEFSDSLNRQKFRDRQQFFWAEQQQTVASAVGRISPTLKDSNGNHLGLIGNFVAQNSPDVTLEFFAKINLWFREHQVQTVIGPIDGDTWNRYRVNVGPFDRAPFLMEPTNPEYYANLWQSAGFSTVDSFHSKVVDELSIAADATAAGLTQARQKGYEFRKFDASRFEHELNRLYEISLNLFDGNFLYEQISRSDFVSLYQPAKPLIDDDLIWFAEDSNGQTVGFLFCIVDYYHAVQAMNGQSHWLAKIRFWLNRHRAKAVNFKSIGVLPEHRRASIAKALMHLGYQNTIKKGFHHAHLCLIRDGNASTKLDGGQGKIFRRYELYQNADGDLTG